MGRTITFNFPAQHCNIGRNIGYAGRGYAPVSQSSMCRLWRVATSGRFACVHRDDRRGTVGFTEIAIVDGNGSAVN